MCVDRYAGITTDENLHHTCVPVDWLRVTGQLEQYHTCTAHAVQHGVKAA